MNFNTLLVGLVFIEIQYVSQLKNNYQNRYWDLFDRKTIEIENRYSNKNMV